MSTERHLREKARTAIETGKLPSRRPDGVWGGEGAGSRCAVCGEPVGHGQLELEIEFLRPDGERLATHHVHVPCFAAWDSERGKARPAGSSNGHARAVAAAAARRGLAE